MNREFNLKYDQIRENQQSKQQDEPTTMTGSSNALYSEAGYARNICFVSKDGKRLFLNYSYLINCAYDGPANTILLSFTSHTITLKGISLEVIFYQLMHQQLKQIVCENERYNTITNEDRSVVNEIIIHETE